MQWCKSPTAQGQNRHEGESPLWRAGRPPRQGCWPCRASPHQRAFSVSTSREWTRSSNVRTRNCRGRNRRDVKRLRARVRRDCHARSNTGKMVRRSHLCQRGSLDDQCRGVQAQCGTNDQEPGFWRAMANTAAGDVKTATCRKHVETPEKCKRAPMRDAEAISQSKLVQHRCFRRT